jgi:hypothetical protein
MSDPEEKITWNTGPEGQEEITWHDKPIKQVVVDVPAPPAPTLGEKALATGVAGLAGLAAPIAGAAEFFGINKPADVVRDVLRSTSEVAPVAAPVAEFAGSVFSPLPTKLGNLAASGVSMVPKLGGSVLARMAGQGAAGAALDPIGTNQDKDYIDFLINKGKQITTGGVLGAGLGKLSQVTLSPNVSEKLQMLKDMGMRYFTPGQLASQIPFVGKTLREGESKSTSVPFVGSAIEHGIRTSAEDMNVALANRVLSNMNETLPKNVHAGDEMIEYLNQKISNAYDKITPKLHISNLSYKDLSSPTGFTTTTKAFVDKVRDVTSGLPSDPRYDLAGMVRNEFEKHILLPLAKNGKMTGEEFRAAEKNLGDVAHRYMKSIELHDVGYALRQLQGELRKELIYQNPKIADTLRGIHNAFIQHLPIERAAGYVGAEGRVFSPSQFESAVKAESKGKGSFASGKATFYPESQAAIDVLGKKIPDSGTAGRLGWATLPLHGWGTVPTAIATGLLYNRPVMGGLTSIATQRPALARRIEPTVSSGLARGAGSQSE